MEYPRSKNQNQRLSSTLVIIRDALIFLLCVLTVILVSVLTARGKTSASAQMEAATTAPESGIAENSNIIAQGEDASASPESTDATAASETNDTPEPIQITPQPTQAPSANGDFSATFPAYDTGSGAMLSHQDDEMRIAINQVQANGVTYFVADVWVKQIDTLRTAFADDAYGRGLHEMPLEIAGENDAVFAVSGDYYGAREDGVVIRNGQLYRDVMGNDICVLHRDGTLGAYQKGSFSALDYPDGSIWQAWAFGPALVENGAVCDTSSSRIKVKNPRCAIGYYAPGHYCFIVVDGRQSGYSDGMTLDELANTFAALGCQTAYNLDGGATAMMVFEGAVVNHPTGGGRASSDIICF